MKEKIHYLPQSTEVPNHLNARISPVSRYLWEPIHRAVSVIKSCCKWIFRALICFLVSMGILACYCLYCYESGWVDLTILSEGDLKHMSGDLLKPKVEGKKK